MELRLWLKSYKNIFTMSEHWVITAMFYTLRGTSRDSNSISGARSLLMWNDYQILFQSLNGWSLRWYNLKIPLLDIPSACPRYLYISHLQVQVARIPGAGNSRWQVARGIGNKARRASELLVQSMTGLGIWATLGGAWQFLLLLRILGKGCSMLDMLSVQGLMGRALTEGHRT